jgi:hypothetical protein
MTIAQVLLSNTFNEFRVTTNQVVSAINAINPTLGTISANTIIANNLSESKIVFSDSTGALVDDANLSFYTTNNTLTLIGDLEVVGITTHTGNVEINGSIIATGNIITLDVEQFRVNDPILLLANNNIANTFDIGFTGHYGSQQLHTGLIRHATDEKYYLFDGYEDHFLANNVIDPSDPSFNLATLVVGNIEATINASSITLGTLDASILANSGVSAGSYGSSVQIPTFSVDEKGRVTSASNVDIVPGLSTGKSIAMAMIFGF